jgi:hypothetical protein
MKNSRNTPIKHTYFQNGRAGIVCRLLCNPREQPADIVIELVYLDLVPWMRLLWSFSSVNPLIGSPGGNWSSELDPFRMKLMLGCYIPSPSGAVT